MLARPLARQLGLPLFAKDAIKERIADALGPAAMDLAGRIGLAAHFMIVDSARELLEAEQSVVLESFFHHGKAEKDLVPLVSMANAVLMHCTARHDILLRRYAERINTPDRHPIHGDGHRIDDMRVYLKNGTADPLDLPVPRLIIDTTTTFPEPTDVARQLHDRLHAHPESIERNT